MAQERGMGLEGRVVLVTGAGGAIGEATARRFAREGAIVVVNDVDVELARTVATNLQERGARALSVAADVTWRADVEAMVNHVVREFGRLDVLVNNAGVNRDAMSHKMTEEQWDQVLTVNLKGTFLSAQAALMRMRERGWGRVINTSSVASLGNIGQANYAASKAG
jgi:3-oxoacyl-[acyl-carrier protein] reductase